MKAVLLFNTTTPLNKGRPPTMPLSTAMLMHLSPAEAFWLPWQYKASLLSISASEAKDSFKVCHLHCKPTALLKALVSLHCMPTTFSTNTETPHQNCASNGDKPCLHAMLYACYVV